jgi:hypothetical protein
MSKKELTTTDQQSPIQTAADILKFGGDLSQLEKLMELQERHETNQARKAYHVAMSEFKAHAPTLKKSKRVAYGNTKYNHADLGEITEEISRELSKHGLSSSWKTEQEGGIKVTCTITHVLGYSERTSLTSPPDNSGGKNSIQAIGSTITYLQRYTLLALTGLAAHDQDDDGKAAEKPKEKPRPMVEPGTKNWENAVNAYLRDGDFEEVLKHADIREEHQAQIREECKNA